MSVYKYRTAINKLALNKDAVVNENLRNLPDVLTKDFRELFLPYVTICVDSREQDMTLVNRLKKHGIAVKLCSKKDGGENLKEGDYTFEITFGDKTYSYIGVVAYERKGSLSELYTNCTKDRSRIEKEFNRFSTKIYDKTVLLVTFNDKITDFINGSFEYYNRSGVLMKKNVGMTVFSTLMSWLQPNNNNFSILQSSNTSTIMWLMLLDMFYYFRQELRLESIAKEIFKK